MAELSCGAERGLLAGACKFRALGGHQLGSPGKEKVAGVVRAQGEGWYLVRSEVGKST